MKTTLELIHTINRLGSSRTPFLFILDFDLRQPLIFPLSALHNNQEILFKIGDRSNALPYREGKPKQAFSFKPTPPTYPTYLKAFTKVQEAIFRGDSFLVNLTLPTPVQTNLGLPDIFFISEARYKLFIQDQFVLFSPETFVEIKEGKLYSYPMKGTIDANQEQAAQKILSDKKEMAEHVTIVDLIRNDMSIHASQVQVDKFRYIDVLETSRGKLLQVSSQISGVLPPDYHRRLGDILFSLLPAGSISGAPKPKTLEIIREAEGYERGYYTGVFGIFDGQDLSSAVMIRFIKQMGNQLIYYSGGGITALSKPEKEYQELIQKVYVPIV